MTGVFPHYIYKIINEKSKITVEFKTFIRIKKDNDYYLVPCNETYTISTEDEKISLDDFNNITLMFIDKVYKSMYLSVPNPEKDTKCAYKISEKERVSSSFLI
jgi:hypothetical protein